MNISPTFTARSGLNEIISADFSFLEQVEDRQCTDGGQVGDR
jgi:hypothetical protein